MTREHYLHVLATASPAWLDSRAWLEVHRGSLLTDTPYTWREVYAAKAYFLGLATKRSRAVAAAGTRTGTPLETSR